MRYMLQILFGLVLVAPILAAGSYLGLLGDDASSGWRLAVGLLLLVAVTQWIAFSVFRHRVALQVLFGLLLSVAVVVWVLYSSFPFFWEHETPQPHVYPVTWRSDAVFFSILAITQGISFLTFGPVRRRRRRESTGAKTSPTGGQNHAAN